MSNQLRNKMYDYEVKPPEASWDKIVTALNNEEVTDGLSSKLYDLEATPPASAWQEIKNSLDQEAKSTISKAKIIHNLIRYAAAIVIITLMVFGGIRLIKSNSGKKEIASIKNTASAKDSSNQSDSKAASTAQLNNIEDSNISSSDDAALEESKQT